LAQINAGRKRWSFCFLSAKSAVPFLLCAPASPR